ncbi:aminoacyl-tRNA hydrolase [Marinospirillum alkaliphilum]|uniref:Peptidyl-tRNA hydrolase n=1 Tax=Marinospirillum alkaliphilum DSM 21637 TaxID=1122209 RepID=A0A1K1YZA9_9GAMM|nr:aminoacyl-tRNA hydrolase [Marinospirillum alkaliphilum]SFX66700.1 peptidyl-tRNA hydrolase, PTH1 family [Marinospirillum alkaliphilum DSM 21637]
MTASIKLIVGLGNPGAEYARTRHNAGAWLVEQLAQHTGSSLKPGKFHGLHAQINLHGHPLHLLIPTTYMNRSGQAIAALAGFYKIEPEAILVAHDELDLAPGTVRLKKGGGHGGHNGLRDTISALGNNREFHRLRIGIGHPGNASQVTGYVLGKAPENEQLSINAALDETERYLDKILAGNLTAAMNHLHAFKA